MKLQGRNLSRGTQGSDVALLQTELQQLGYAVPTTEVASASFGAGTYDAVGSFQAKNGLPITNTVDQTTADKINAAVDALNPALQNFVVRGQIRQADARVFVGAVVRVVDKELRRETPLGEAITDQDGRYEIKYTSARLDGDEKPRADLIVRVFSSQWPALAPPTGKGLPSAGGIPASASPRGVVASVASSVISDGPSALAVGAVSIPSAAGVSPAVLPSIVPVPLATSAVIFNAPTVATVDLMIGGGVYAGPSEYEQLVAAVTPALQGLSPADLTDDDVAFLAGETGLPSDRIGFFAAAAKLAQQTELPSEVFYGFAREKLPTDLPALLAQGREAQRRALQAALNDNLVPAKLGGALDDILQKLQERAVAHALEGMQPAGRASLAGVLGTVLPEPNKQQTLMTLYAQRTGTVEEFWQTVAQHPDFSVPGQVEAMQTAIQVSVLAQNHAPMVQQLQEMRQKGKWKSLRDLAQFDRNDWLRLVQTQGVGVPPGMPGKGDTERAQNYAAYMNSLMEKAFPTAVIAARLQKEGESGSADLQRFFANNPDFEFGSTHIDSYIAAHRATALEGTRAPESVAPQLKTMQRVFKVAPQYDQLKVLLDAGLHSARSVAQLGKSAFVAGFAAKLGGPAQALAVFARAERAAAAAAAIFGKFAPAMNATDPMVTRRTS